MVWRLVRKPRLQLRKLGKFTYAVWRVALGGRAALHDTTQV